MVFARSFDLLRASSRLPARTAVSALRQSGAKTQTRWLTAAQRRQVKVLAVLYDGMRPSFLMIQSI